MSSIYEDELSRLIEEKRARIDLLKQKGAKSKEITKLQADLDILETDLKRYRKAVERFRVKPTPPTSSPAASTSGAS